jgi:hypothetical protein
MIFDELPQYDPACRPAPGSASNLRPKLSPSGWEHHTALISRESIRPLPQLFSRDAKGNGSSATVSKK